MWNQSPATYFQSRRHRSHVGFLWRQLRQVTDEDVILRSDGWWCGTETIFHCTITELLHPDSLPEHIQAQSLPGTCSHATSLSGLIPGTAHSETL